MVIMEISKELYIHITFKTDKHINTTGAQSQIKHQYHEK